MHFDAALNLAWLFLGSALLVATACGSRRSPPLGRRASWLKLAGVVVIAGTLFPYVSATDDLIWMEGNASRSEHSSNRSDSNSGRHLVNLYQAAEASLLVRTIRVGCIFVFVSLMLLPVYAFAGYSRRQVMGRSPPLRLAF